MYIAAESYINIMFLSTMCIELDCYIEIVI